ncbi:LOW QUALITY PROTEIN: DNA (cytosine-5)-methyltransferase 3A-like [Macrobrachium nipponense]|uniref:LOW QUALITY PROTEIN: DNA (cytosine-5)-methyltransferase 3A-like n=1 Tax=Macrobrachium nipponense TaxID=159736 RepID=UPI0030C7D21E
MSRIMMDSQDEVQVISDDDGDGACNGFLPRIVSSTSLSSGGSESGFSGFCVTNDSTVVNRRLPDDLEIVEVIRNVMPIHYRERKMGFPWLKVKKEYPTFCNELPLESVSSNSKKVNLDSWDNDETTPNSKRRSFAAMRPSLSSIDKRLEKRQKLNSSLMEEEQPPLPPLDFEVTTLEDSEDETLTVQTSKENDRNHLDGLPLGSFRKSSGQRQCDNSEELPLCGETSDVDPNSKKSTDKSNESNGKELSSNKKSHSDNVPHHSSRKSSGKRQRDNSEELPVLDENFNSNDSSSRGSTDKSDDESDGNALSRNRKSHSDDVPLRNVRKSSEKKQCDNSDSNDSSSRASTDKSGESDGNAISRNKKSHSGDVPLRNVRKSSGKRQYDHSEELPVLGENVDSNDSKHDGNTAGEVRQSTRVSNIISNHDYGRLVWGKTGSSRPWPAVIVCYEQCGEQRPPADKAWLLWFGDYRITLVPLPAIKDFAKSFQGTFVNTYNPSYNSAVLECLKECRKQSGLEELTHKRAYIRWGENGLTGLKNTATGKGECSPNVARCLSRIRKMRLREKSSTSEASFFPTSASNSEGSCAEERGTWKPKAALLKAVRDGKHDIEKLCIACDRIDCEVVAPHPYFHGGTCSACKRVVDMSVRASNMYCIICGSPGELIVCDGDECEKVFCTGCIELLVSPKAVKDIMDTDPWECFFCTPYKLGTHGLLKPRPDWKEKAASGPSDPQENLPEVEDDTPDISTFSQKPMRVLSLFDGISTGLFVLDKLGLEIEFYYAAEINESAKNVASLNFGPRVVNIGDVQAVSDKKVSINVPPFDLLIGGSPCNDLSLFPKSFVNPNRKGLFDPTGTGILFFHYFRVLKTILLHNKGTHLFWLFENVTHMPREFKFQISTFLQREPAIIDAKYFSPQSRPRCFWGNIPDMYKPLPPEVLNKAHPLGKCVAKVTNRKALAEKVNCITTNTNSLKQVFKMSDHADYPWITEIEKIFGFPAHYTDVGNLSLRERQALLGRSWSVGVVEYILKPLTKYFPVCQEKRKENEDSANNEVSSNNFEHVHNGNDQVCKRNSVTQTCLVNTFTENMKVSRDKTDSKSKNHSSHHRSRACNGTSSDLDSESEFEKLAIRKKNDKNYSKSRNFRLTRNNVRLSQRQFYPDCNRQSDFNQDKQRYKDISSVDGMFSSSCKGLPRFKESPGDSGSFSGFSSVVLREECQHFLDNVNEFEPLESPSELLSNIDTDNLEVGASLAEKSPALLVNHRKDILDSSSDNCNNPKTKTSCNVDSIMVENGNFPSEVSDCSLGMFVALENFESSNSYETELSEYNASDPLSDNSL